MYEIKTIKEKAELIKTNLYSDSIFDANIKYNKDAYKERLKIAFNVTDNEVTNSKVIVYNYQYDIVILDSNLNILVQVHDDSDSAPNETYDLSNGIKITFLGNEYKQIKGNDRYVKLNINILNEISSDSQKLNVIMNYFKNPPYELSADISSITTFPDWVLLYINTIFETSYTDFKGVMNDETFQSEFGQLSTTEEVYAAFASAFELTNKTSLTEQECFDLFYEMTKSSENTEEAKDTLKISLKKDSSVEEIGTIEIKSGQSEINKAYCISSNGNYELIIENASGEKITKELVVSGLTEDIDDYILSKEETFTKYGGGVLENSYYVSPSIAQGNVIIPYVVGYDEVNSIYYGPDGDPGFSNCRSITGIEIPNSMTTIPEYAFQYCSSLQNIVIPNNVTSIGESAFKECSSLKTVTLPDNLLIISSRMFFNCNSLESIIIPNTVLTLGEYAFSGCEALTSITIPNGVTSIGQGAFYSCASLTSIIIPDTVTTLGDSAFDDCDSLKNITLSKNLKKVNAFSRCLALESIVIPNGVEEIGGFSGCTKLSNVQISNTVTKIGSFAGCLALENITIPNSVTTIQNGAFASCNKLANIYFKKGTNSIPAGKPWGAPSATVTEID